MRVKNYDLLITKIFAVIVGTLLASCGGNSFSGISDVKKEQPRSGTQNDIALPSSEQPDPTPDISLPIEPKANIDYAGCAALPANGKRGLGHCNANEAIVIVNDGRAGEMTCCPIGNNVFSTVAAEQNVRREGKCRADEVATGIEDLGRSIILCTKVNTQFLKTEYRATSIYAKSNSPGNLGALANAYNIGDCCVCPEGSVFTGNHTATDNKCTDECVAIVKR